MHRPFQKGSIPKDQILIGIHALTEVLTHAPHKLVKVYAETLQSESRKSNILDLCQKKGIPVAKASFDALSDMAGTDSHQSFVAHIRPRDFLTLKDFLKEREDADKCTLLMLDQIFDPQNMGAILRSAECFGVDAVIFSKNRGSDITPSVTKASCGASELVPLIRLSNLAEALTLCQEAGFEAVAAQVSDGAGPLSTFRFAPKTLLIVGSEGEGIQPLIQKRVDRSVYIPMEGRITSLNVAQATSILLYSRMGHSNSTVL